MLGHFNVVVQLLYSKCLHLYHIYLSCRIQCFTVKLQPLLTNSLFSMCMYSSILLTIFSTSAKTMETLLKKSIKFIVDKITQNVTLVFKVKPQSSNTAYCNFSYINLHNLYKNCIG